MSHGRTRAGTVQTKLGGSQGEKNASVLAEELFFTSNVSWSVLGELGQAEPGNVSSVPCSAEQVQGSRREGIFGVSRCCQ